MVGLRLLGRPSAYCSIHLSSYQDIYLKAHGSASIYSSSQGWLAHVFKKNLRPGNVSTALLHLAFLFSLLIVIFLKALNVVGLLPICRCKGGRCMSFRGAFGLVRCPFPRGMNVVGLIISNEKTLPRFNFEGLPLTSASCSPYVMYSSSPLPFTWLRVEGLDHWGMKEHT